MKDVPCIPNSIANSDQSKVGAQEHPNNALREKEHTVTPSYTCTPDTNVVNDQESVTNDHIKKREKCMLTRLFDYNKPGKLDRLGDHSSHLSPGMGNTDNAGVRRSSRIKSATKFYDACSGK